KKKIDAVESLSRKQKMSREKKYDEDLINFIIDRDSVYLMLFNVHRGLLENKQEFVFDYKRDFLDEFIIQYYSENDIPRELILSKQPDESLSGYLRKVKSGSVRIVTPKKGEKKALLDLVKKNIELTYFGDIKTLESLKEKLNLSEIPSVIECFDISHISGSFTTASMVQFRNGLPDKSNYRRFRIKYTKGIDDVKSISEVVTRRYTRLKKEESVMPDLILIDGGIGQLNGALNSLKDLNLNIPVVSVAKREEEIYIPGEDNPLKMGKSEAALQLIQRIRDEAHRFAITYNRLLRKKDLIN
ncbi:MAG: excinuclease ABC subunit C, partial [Candidatus Aminicenantes bacterium]|nr:excinuclease ABC subunit C [Candidatus Aminicenantes bacterium]